MEYRAPTFLFAIYDLRLRSHRFISPWRIDGQKFDPASQLISAKTGWSYRVTLHLVAPSRLCHTPNRGPARVRMRANIASTLFSLLDQCTAVLHEREHRQRRNRA
jgi:hypothetical protein